MTTAAPGGLVDFPSWYSEDWDSSVVEGVTIPGLTKVGKIKRGPKWDRKPVKGQSFENQTFGGWNGAAFEIVVRLWTKAQQDEFRANVLPVVEPTPGKEAPKQLAFFHPQAAARKVDVILVDDVEGPEVDDDAQFEEWTLTVFESRKPAPAPKGPGKPGLTPCQQARADYDYWMGVATTISDNLASLILDIDAFAKASHEYQVAMDKAVAAQTLMDGLGCANQSPGSQAVGGGEPDP